MTRQGLLGDFQDSKVFRYVDEQAFRFNNRVDTTDADRCDLAVRGIVGKRLTWDRLTGKEVEIVC